jgi:hypothetical protein
MKCNDLIGRILDWIHFMHFRDRSVMQVLCINGKFPLQQSERLKGSTNLCVELPVHMPIAFM